jgi:hypothetical protein
MSLFSTADVVSMIADTETGAGIARVATSEGVQVREMQWSAAGATTPASSAPNGVTASYSGLDLGAAPRFAMATFSFTAGSANSGSAVLIANPNGLSQIAQITNGSLHLAFTDTKADIGIFASGVLSAATIPYLRALAKDGTRYRGGFAVSTSQINVLLPDGREHIIAGAGYSAAAGRYCQFQSYSSVGVGIRATFHAVTFERAP